MDSVLGYLDWETIFPLHSPQKTLSCLTAMAKQIEHMSFENYSDQNADIQLTVPYNNIELIDYFEKMVQHSSKLSLTTFQKEVYLLFNIS
jgi:hypothetical protein